MLKALRRGAIDNPWFYRIIMGGIAAAFVVTMGSWGIHDFNSRSERVVATVDLDEISLSDYQAVLRQIHESFRERAPEASQIDDKLFKQAAIDELVNREIWLKGARDLGLTVSNEELMESIAKYPAFQKEGKPDRPGSFDLERYHQVLGQNHLTSEGFEKGQREDLLVDKTKKLLQDSVQLSQNEIEEAKKNTAQGQDPERSVSDALYQKRQKALLAFSNNLKSHSKIVIRQELL